MAEKMNLQDRFLNNLRVNKIEVKVYFDGGFQTNGFIKSFDEYTVLIEKNGQQSLLYKSAVNKIVPTRSVSLYQPQQFEQQPQTTTEEPKEE